MQQYVLRFGIGWLYQLVQHTAVCCAGDKNHQSVASNSLRYGVPSILSSLVGHDELLVRPQPGALQMEAVMITSNVYPRLPLMI
jgi:hypothetical protein